MKLTRKMNLTSMWIIWQTCVAHKYKETCLKWRLKGRQWHKNGPKNHLRSDFCSPPAPHLTRKMYCAYGKLNWTTYEWLRMISLMSKHMYHGSYPRLGKKAPKTIRMAPIQWIWSSTNVSEGVPHSIVNRIKTGVIKFFFNSGKPITSLGNKLHPLVTLSYSVSLKS